MLCPQGWTHGDIYTFKHTNVLHKLNFKKQGMDHLVHLVYLVRELIKGAAKGINGSSQHAAVDPTYTLAVNGYMVQA